MAILKKSYYFENTTQTAAGVQKYTVGDISQLRDAPILGVEFYDANDVTVTYSGATPCTTADLKKAYLVLYFALPKGSGQGEYLTIPAYQLVKVHDNVTSATNHPYADFIDQLAGQVIDWSKSYVWFGTAPSTASRSIHFNIYYQDKA
jgi:hypothetical protein